MLLQTLDQDMQVRTDDKSMSLFNAHIGVLLLRLIPNCA